MISPSYDKFVTIISDRNITPYRIAKDTGLNTVLFADWKKGKSKPKIDKLTIIADYLNIPVSALQDDTEMSISSNYSPFISLSDQEKTLLAMFRETSEEGRFRMIQAVMNIKDEVEKKRNTVSDQGFAG